MGSENLYGSDIVTDREKRELIKKRIEFKHRNYTEEEIEAALEEKLEIKNTGLRQTTEPLPKKRYTQKLGVLSRSSLKRIVNPKLTIVDIIEFGLVIGLIVFQWFCTILLFWAAFRNGDAEAFFAGLILLSVTAFFTYNLIKSRISGARDRESIEDSSLKIKAYRIVDMARENIGTDSTHIICHLYLNSVSGNVKQNLICEYKDYSRFREDDYIYCIYFSKSNRLIYYFREEEWDYDDEFTKLMIKEKNKIIKRTEKKENGKQN